MYLVQPWSRRSDGQQPLGAYYVCLCLCSLNSCPHMYVVLEAFYLWHCFKAQGGTLALCCVRHTFSLPLMLSFVHVQLRSRHRGLFYTFSGEHFTCQAVADKSNVQRITLSRRNRHFQSTSGWTNDDSGLAWLEQRFDRYTKEKTGRSWRLLTIDSHGSRWISWSIAMRTKCT